MGIREYIEGLIVITPAPYDGEFVLRNSVLSILDEHLGECETEHSIGSLGAEIHRIAFTDNGDFVTDFVLRPGDHISIYVRRSHEDKLD